jgi:hypothetical protein
MPGGNDQLHYPVVKTETNTESLTLAIVDTGYKAGSADHKAYGDLQCMDGNAVQS